MPAVELYVCRTHRWKEQGQEKVSHVDHIGPPSLLCPQPGDIGHATSISSHKATQWTRSMLEQAIKLARRQTVPNYTET